MHARAALSAALFCPTSYASALQAAQFKAMRCFFAAHGLLVTGKLPEAHALFGRAAQRASEASSLHEVRLAQQQPQQLPTGYKMLWQPPSCSGCQLD